MPAQGRGIRIIIVNYRTPRLVVDCLRSLESEIQAEEDCRVVVVENHSQDDSQDQISAAVASQGWEAWVELLTVEQNRGFAAGNNLPLGRMLEADQMPQFVLLLNPDTVVRPGAVRELRRFMERHPEVGIAGSRLEDPDGTPQRSAFRFFGVLSELNGGLSLGIVSKLLLRWEVAPPVRDCEHPTDWVAGASMMIRPGVFDSIGLLDDDYFLYYEEVDFCLRARRAGWTCWYVPKSRVVHLVGQATGVTNEKSAVKRLPRYWFESRRRYFTKNHGPIYRFAADVAFAVGFSLWRLRRWVQRKPDTDPPHLLGDFFRFNFLRLSKDR